MALNESSTGNTAKNTPTALHLNSSSTATNSVSKAERFNRLRDLHLKRNEARKLNHKEVLEEEKRAQLPSNFEAKKRRAEWILQDEEKKAKCEAEGEDYERVKLLDVQADDLERITRQKARKKKPNTGFSTYEDATAQQYNRLVSNIKINKESYEAEKEELGDSFYADKDTILKGKRKDKKEDIDRMVADLEKIVEKREKHKRRRMHNDDADIDYINEGNMKFNKKLELYYGTYTAEIKQNLERGTAI